MNNYSETSNKEYSENVDFHPLVSVIVPECDDFKYLKKRLASIYNQTYPNTEVILIGSNINYKTLKTMLKYKFKYSKNTKIIINKKLNNIYSQWEAGIKTAKGSFIWIAGNQNYCEENFIEKLIPSFKDDMVMLAFGKTISAKDSKEADTWRTKSKYNFDEPFVETAHNIVNYGFGYRNLIPFSGSVIVRNTGFKTIFNNQEWKKLHCFADWIFYLDCIKGGIISYNPDAVDVIDVKNKTEINADDYIKEIEIIAQYISLNYKADRDVYKKLEENITRHTNKLVNFNIESLANNPNRKLNIVMTGMRFNIGGGETFPIYLANMLKEMGHSVTYFVLEDTEYNAQIRNLLDKSIPCTGTSNITIKKLCKIIGADIIHTGHLLTDYEVEKYILPSDCKHVVTCHGMYNAVIPSLIQSRLPVLMRNVHKWFYIADNNLIPFEENGFKIDDKFVKIPNGLPQSEIKPVKRKILKIENNAFVLCVVSRGIEEKGWIEAIEAVKIVQEKTKKNVHLVILGDGEMYDKLVNTTPDYIHLTGFKQNTRDYIAMSDVFLLPSKYKGESFPLVIIDALFCNKPVISTDLGEVRNMLTYNGKIAGRIFELDENMTLNPDKLADIIIDFMKDKTKYSDIINELKKRFTIEAIADEYEKHYYTLLNKQKKEIYITGAESCTYSLSIDKLKEEKSDINIKDTGDIITGDFSRKLFDNYKSKNPVYFPSSFIKDLDYINTNCERVIISANNWLAENTPDVDFASVNNIAEKIKIPINIMGLGSNINLENLNKEYMKDFVKHLNPDFINFLHLCSEKSHSMSVNGNITKELLDLIGIKNVTVTGSPIWFINKENNIKIIKNELTQESVIYMHCNKQKYYAKMNDLFINYPNRRLVIQTEFDLLKYSNHENLNKYPNSYDLPDEFFKRKWDECFIDSKKWSSAIASGVDLSFGFRTQSTVITLKNGKPAIIVINDSASKEMSEFFNIPSVSLNDIENKDFRIEEIYNNSDFSVLENSYEALYKNFNDYLNENGIK